jgi:phosphoenolpyruvate carboxykinase (ATP)
MQKDIRKQLADYDIENIKKIYHNPGYGALYRKELSSKNSGFEKARKTELGALTVDTGKFTGRSPKDKFIVGGGPSAENIWWQEEGTKGSDNKPVSIETWDHLYSIATRQLSGKNLYVMDGFAGASEENRLQVRMVTEVAWQAHFFKNMLIRPKKAQLENFSDDWVILNACKATCTDYEEHGLNSENFVVINIEKKMILIGGTWYGGEIKKGIFSVMNYVLPLKGVGAFHCSANKGKKSDTALFFGLSGTGKTTLSTDPDRELIGDDEHGWDDEGIFNFEGGCYAKVINLSKEHEPDIYNAIKRDALLENVVVDKKGKVDFSSDEKTQNTRVSYPIYHIKNACDPSVGDHPKTIVFLTCDSFGVLPPVAKLNREQAEYMFLSGYTAKVAGTERGVDEPQATFSACFGAPFLLLHPTVYADILGKKIDQHNSSVYLVNTGWTGGGYGVGTRIDLPVTRKIVTAVLKGNLEKIKFEKMQVFNLQIPTKITGVSSKLLNPKNTWSDRQEYDRNLRRLARKFVENFKQFTDTESGYELSKSGPEV